MAKITIQVGDQSHQVTVDDSFKDLTPDQQQAEVEHIAAQIGANKTSGGSAVAPSMVEKAADAVGIDDTMLAPAVGTAIGATTGAALGPGVGSAVDFIANKLADKTAAPGTVRPEGVPEGVINWYEQESGHPYAGGKTKEAAYAKGQRAAGEPVESRGAKIPIRKGNLGITNQIEPTKPTLAQKAAANIINAEKVGTPGMTRRMAGMGVVGGELGNIKEELSKGNYGRAALSGLGALGGAASQSKIKPVRAVGTGLSAIVPTIQMMLPDEEDQSNINKKNGGQIQHYDVGSKVKKLGKGIAEESGPKIMDILKERMAPLYAKSEGIPAPLPRATPKTDEEIRAFAERMAPQVRGDFVRAPGASTSVAGKTRAQFEREKDLEHDIRDVFPLKQIPNYSDAQHQGKVKIGIAGDQTLTGKDVYEIAGNKLSSPSRQYGGALYPAAHPQGWASEKGAAQTVQNLTDEVAQQYGTDVLGQYMKMGPEASNYAMHNADAIIKSINPNQIKQLDKLNAMIRDRFPDFAGIENQAAILEQAKQNPDLRKYLDYLVGIKKHAETYGLPSGADIRHALSEPDLRNLEIGATGKSIMQMHPGAKITPSSELTTTTYSHDIPGTYVGGTKYPRPHELEFADSYAALQNKIADVQDMAKQVIAENPKLDPSDALAYAKKYGHQGFGGFRLSQPRQIMDQQYMDETGKYEDYMKQLLGFAPGGKVAKEAVEAFKKKFTPGFYHGSPSPNITSFDPLKSKVRDVDFVTPGVTFVTKSPNFADSFTNGKGPYISLKTGEAIPAQAYTKGATMYPVSVDMSNHFDPTTPEGREIVRAYVAKKYADDPAMARKFSSRIEDPHSNWTTMESPSFLQHLRDTGHTSFAVNESGYPNVGVLDPSKIRGKFAKYNPEDAESPDFMKAAGGPVQHFDTGRAVRAGLSNLANFVRHPHGQDPKVAQALEDYLKGNISQEERMRIMNQQLPIRKWADLPPNYTDEEIRNALTTNKQAKALAPVPVGMRVGNRLDIPAYTKHGVYVDTTHDAAGKPISYGRTGHLKDVEFSSSPDTFVRVGLGTREQALTPLGAEIGTSKTPRAMIKGIHQGTPDEEVRRMMAEMIKDPRYTQIGMDPRKHSQFYDKSTGLPVWSAEEKLQSGPLILAPKQGLEITDWNDPRLNLTDFEGKKYKKGSKVKKK